MTTGSQLASEMAQVIAPAGTGYTVRPVPGLAGYSVGRGADGVVVVLTPPDKHPDPPTRLRSLTLDPQVRLRLEDPNGQVVEEDRGLIALRSSDQTILEPFLAVAAAVIRLLGDNPEPGAVSAAMRRLVKIFDRTEPPRGSVLGLFGELCVIAASNDPASLVDAWHARVDQRFDFSADGSRLEVKTTQKDVREHVFGLPQLKPVAGATCRIASIMTTETDAGTSIGELIDKIHTRLAGDADRQVKVHQQVAAALGSDWVLNLGHRFDQTQAEDTMVVLDPALVPQIEDPPVGVVSVTLTVDCSEVPADEAPRGLAALVRSRSRGGPI
jgi:hypothetical protein